MSELNFEDNETFAELPKGERPIENIVNTPQVGPLDTFGASLEGDQKAYFTALKQATALRSDQRLPKELLPDISSDNINILRKMMFGDTSGFIQITGLNLMIKKRVYFDESNTIKAEELSTNLLSESDAVTLISRLTTDQLTDELV